MNGETKTDLATRTRQFAVDVICLVQTLPKSMTSDVVGRQLLRAATSVGANYLEARRARSPADFISKINIAEGEAAECHYWLQLLSDSHVSNDLRLVDLIKEANELTAILTASGNTAKRRYGKK